MRKGINMQHEYDNIIRLAQKHDFNKIMIKRNSWGDGSWCIVNEVDIKSDGIYGYARGHIHYSNGNTKNGMIPCAGTYAWRVIKVLDEKMKVKYL